jgi:hypothetical protein
MQEMSTIWSHEIDLSRVLNVVELTTAKNVKKSKKRQQHANYGEAIILPTTNVANIITT